MNVSILVGRLTDAIELKYTQSGDAVGTFTLAVNRNFKNKQGETEADFIRCQVWRKQAENLAKFTRKGSQIGIEGRIQTRNYENQQGTRVYVTEIVVNNFHLLEPKEVTEQRPQGQQSQQQPNFNHNSGQQQQWGGQQQQQNFSGASPVNVKSDDLPF